MDSTGLYRGCLVLALLTILAVDASVVNRQQRQHDLGLPIDDAQDQSDTVVVRAAEVPTDRISYDGCQVWRVRTSGENSEVVSQLEDTGDLSTWTGNSSVVDVLVRPETIPKVSRVLRKRNVNFDVVIPDLQKAIEQENPLPSVEEMEELEGRKGHRMEWTSYHPWEDIEGYLDYLAQTYPEICSVKIIGKSVENRNLKVLRISNGKEGIPAIWIDGGIHAREWISPAAVTYTINYLVENSDKLEADYYILPVLNPDGYVYTWDHDRLWRKNRSNANKGRCAGVDLNRNYGYRWGGLGSSKNPCREDYGGTGAFSEPETAAVRDFFESSGANFKAFLTFHSYGQYILYPWGYDRRVPPDYAELDKVGRKAAMLMKESDTAGSAYTVGNSAYTLYPAAGGADDWAKAMQRIKYSYTIELRDSGTYGFVLPARFIVSTSNEALAFVKTITEACVS